MQQHELYMHRCLHLARLGEANVAPNPMVGAVLVYDDRIIGEGHHEQYGKPHAEVNCLSSVSDADKNLVSSSTLYVSLEPCAHFGKTPPCADLIIRNKIPKVVIGCRDPFEEVDGKGIEKLQQAGVEVIVGILEDDCIDLNKCFFTFHNSKRPYIILKWAESNNRIIGLPGGKRISISNDITNRLVYKWRGAHAAILVGTNTALNDDPQLNTRLWSGNNPIRLIIDLNLRLPATLKVFDGSQRTIIFNFKRHDFGGTTEYYQLSKNESLPIQIVKACFQLKILSVLIEGGAQTLQSFINEGLWDEARVIENRELVIAEGVAAPYLINHKIAGSESIKSDTIFYYKQDKL